jgi:fatty-acyl-CoA synthase
MQGLMQDWPLTVDRILDHARNVHGRTEVVTRALDGVIHRTTYAAINERARRLTSALLALGVRPGDRVGTIAWNTAAHLEAWYGVMGMGAVCHTMNPRLLPAQLAWMTDHAGDRVLMADVSFAPLIGPILAGAPGVEHLIWMTDEAGLPPITAPDKVKVHALETLIADAAPTQAWGGFDENTAGGLCYTSGTTGDPKGVLYSHRSNVLHALFTMQADVLGATARDTVLAVVPMFHANGWGLPFSAPASGAKMIMPGARLDGASIHELIETEQVTFSAAVPTVWANLLSHLRETGKRIDSLKSVIIGGAAVNEAMMRAYQDEYGVEVIHAWGMTETSPLGSVSRHTVRTGGLDADGQMAVRMKQGRPPFGVELKVIGEDGQPLPHDGQAFGRLLARGPAVASAYFRSEDAILDADGFFDTGDIATLDHEGFMQITDRAKDVIKSGGEWISSIEIENHVLAHPAVEAAAVVGVPHPKWNERPVLLVKARAGESVTHEDLVDHLDGKIARWWMPNDTVFVDAIPLGATGKVDKKALRASLSDYQLPPDDKPVALAAAVAAAPVLHAPEPQPAEPEPNPDPAPEAQAAVEPEPAGTVAPADEPQAVPEAYPVLAPEAASPPVEAEAPPEPLADQAPFPARDPLPEPQVQPVAPAAEIGPFPTASADPVMALAVAAPAARLVLPTPPARTAARQTSAAGRARFEAALRILAAAGVAALLLTIACGLLAPAYLGLAYRIEVAVLALALIGFVGALALDWKAFGRNAVIALSVALIGLGAALVLTSVWQPRGSFPAADGAQGA